MIPKDNSKDHRDDDSFSDDIDGSSRGWIKLHRRFEKYPIFQDEHLWRLWTFLLMRASHSTHSVPMKCGKGKRLVTLKPGQVIVGRSRTAEKLGWFDSTFRNRLEKLEEMGLVSIEKDSHYSIVSIANWLTDQARTRSKRTGKGHTEDTQRTGKGQPKDTYKNEKNEERRFKNEDKGERPVPSRDDIESVLKEVEFNDLSTSNRERLMSELIDECELGRVGLTNWQARAREIGRIKMSKQEKTSEEWRLGQQENTSKEFRW